MASGVTTLIVHSEDLDDDLHWITTLDGAGVIPAAVLTGDHVVAQVSSSGSGCARMPLLNPGGAATPPDVV